MEFQNNSAGWRTKSFNHLTRKIKELTNKVKNEVGFIEEDVTARLKRTLTAYGDRYRALASDADGYSVRWPTAWKGPVWPPLFFKLSNTEARNKVSQHDVVVRSRNYTGEQVRSIAREFESALDAVLKRFVVKGDEESMKRACMSWDMAAGK